MALNDLKLTERPEFVEVFSALGFPITRHDQWVIGETCRTTSGSKRSSNTLLYNERRRAPVRKTTSDKSVQQCSSALRLRLD